MSTLVGLLDGKENVAPAGRVRQFFLFVVFLVCMLAIFVFGCNYFDIFSTNRNLSYQLFLSALFLFAAVLCKRDERLKQYWQIPYALFTASFVLVVTSLFGGWNRAILNGLSLTITSSQGQAIAKVYEVLMVIVPILVLTKLAGADLGSIYLQRGKPAGAFGLTGTSGLKWGLGIGGLVWFNFAAGAFLFFATRFTSIDTMSAALLWGIVFSCANGLMEELWLRGLFLRHFQPVIGVGGAVLVTALVYALMHGGSTYTVPIAIPFYVVNTLTIGLACGYLTIKTDSIWGAWLIHAAADLFLFIGMLANA